MAKVNRIEYLIQRAGNNHICANCEHFHEHFVKIPSPYNAGGFQFQSIDEGHCSFPRFKVRKAWTSCEHWQEKKGN